MAENPRIEELRRRVQADPASIAFAALAEEFRRVGNYADAIETCRTGLQRHPAYLSARVTLGRALIETGDYEAAREELQIVLQSAPENLAATRGLAQINEHLGQSTEMHPDLHALVEDKRTERLEIEQTRKLEQARLDLETAARAQAEREQAARDQAARDQFAREQALRDQATREQAAREQATRDQATRDQATREQAAREQAAREQAVRDAAAREQAARDTAARDQAARDQADRARAEQDQPPPLSLDTFDLNLAPVPGPAAADEPFDIFAAALQRPSEPAAPLSPFTFEPAITLEPPASPDAPELDAHVAAAVVRLERFLGAIHAARHA